MNSSIVFLLINLAFQISTAESPIVSELPTKILDILGTELGKTILNGIIRIYDFTRTREVETCYNDLQATITALKEGDQWAFQALDSFSKPSISISFRSLPRICHRLNQEETPFQMHYCYLELNLSMLEPMKFPIGVCLPSSCSQNILNDFLNAINEIFEIAKKDSMMEFRCSYETDLSLSAKVVLMICAVLLILVVSATVYDLRLQRSLQRSFLEIKKKTDIIKITTECNDKEAMFLPLAKCRSKSGSDSIFRKLFLCFSAVTNGRELFELNHGSVKFPVLNGMRGFCILGVVVGHVTMVHFFSDNLVEIPTIIQFLQGNILIAVTYEMNIFFVISGFLNSYNYISLKPEKRKSWQSQLLNRYLRISPAFYIALLIEWKFSAYLFPSRLNFMHQINTLNCEKSWWLSLLYSQNFLPLVKQCLGAGWYLANDFQLFAFSLPILALMQRSKKYVLVVSISITIATMIAAFIMCEKYDIEILIPRVLTPGNNTELPVMQFLNQMYGQPWFRCNGYLLGMLCGLFVSETKCQVKLSKIQVTTLWAIALLICIPAIFVVSTLQLSTVLSGMFVNLYGTIWPLGFCIIIFLCCNGYGNFTTKFFSWEIWAPLSRLSLCLLVSHVMIIQWITYKKDTIFHFSYSSILIHSMIVIKLSILAAAVFHLIVEKPFSRITSLIL